MEVILELSYQGNGNVINYVRKSDPISGAGKSSIIGSSYQWSKKRILPNKEDLEKHAKDDPLPKLRKIIADGISDEELRQIDESGNCRGNSNRFSKAVNSPKNLIRRCSMNHVFAPTNITEEKGERVLPVKKKSLWLMRLCLPFGKLWKIFLK